MEEVGFADAHVFTYSIRPGTPAEKFQQVSDAKKTERTHAMLDTCSKLRTEHLKKQVGTIREVLAERMRDNATWEGFTENYCPVHFVGDKSLHGQVLKVRINSVDNDVLIGEII